MKEIRIGIIGCGIIANGHAGKYREMPGVKIVAACDILETKLNKFCDRFSIENRYVDFREMLKRDDIDAVDVCVHNNLHMPLTVRVLEAGFHCYCEKPMAGTYRDAKMMYDRAKECGKQLHIQLSTVYKPRTVCAKKFIDDGRLGKIYHARSYGYRRRGRPFVDGYAEKEFVSKYWASGGALYDMGVYHIAMLLYLLDNPKVNRVSGQVYQELAIDAGRKKESGFDVEELGCGFVKFEGGLTMDILESWAIHSAPFPPSMICGSDGGLTIWPTAKSEDEAVVFYSEISGYPASAALDVSAEHYRRGKIDPTTDAYAHPQNIWIAALRGECPWPGSAEIALNTMLVSEGIYKSGALGREVTYDEIITESKSNSLKRQDVPFGVIEYE